MATAKQKAASKRNLAKARAARKKGGSASSTKSFKPGSLQDPNHAFNKVSHTAAVKAARKAVPIRKKKVVSLQDPNHAFNKVSHTAAVKAARQAFPIRKRSKSRKKK
jgi:hypothetical protein